MLYLWALWTQFHARDTWEMDIVIEGLTRVVKLTDDFLIYAKTLEKLRQRTRQLFQRFVDYGVTINVFKKSKFEETEMDFLGHEITKTGIRHTYIQIRFLVIDSFLSCPCVVHNTTIQWPRFFLIVASLNFC